MMRQCLYIVMTMAMAGCAPMMPPEPQIIVKTVNVPVPVTCVSDKVERTAPDYPDHAADIAAAGIQKRAQLVVAANILLHDRNAALEEVLKACVKAVQGEDSSGR